MKSPLVSIIIPTHNRRDLLPRAIQSVLDQSYSHWELIIIDDGSSDDTQDWLLNEVLPAHPNKDIIFKRQDQSGVSSARNKGLQISKGEWIAFLDSDDEWLPQKLEVQLEWAQGHPHIPLIHGEEIWNRNGVPISPKKKHKKGGGRQWIPSLQLCCISPSTSLIKRSLFDELGPFREDFPVCEDYELWLRITARYEIGFIERPLIIKYGGHSDQLSQQYSAMDLWRIEALLTHLDSPYLNIEERLSLIKVLREKFLIFKKGYLKHHLFQITKVHNNKSDKDLFKDFS